MPTPEPGVPTGRVTAPNGVNVRSGPGTNFPVLVYGALWHRRRNHRPQRRQPLVGRRRAVCARRQWVGIGGFCGCSRMPTTFRSSPLRRRRSSRPADAGPHAAARRRHPCHRRRPHLRRRCLSAPAQTTINQGQCATLQWSVENVQAVWVYPQGQPYQQYPRTGQGSEQVCPPTTTTYEMRVLLRDGSITTQRVTVNVVPGAPSEPAQRHRLAGDRLLYRQRSGSPIVGTTLTLRFDGKPDQRQRRLQQLLWLLFDKWDQYLHRAVGRR